MHLVTVNETRLLRDNANGMPGVRFGSRTLIGVHVVVVRSTFRSGSMERATIVWCSTAAEPVCVTKVFGGSTEGEKWCSIQYRP